MFSDDWESRSWIYLHWTCYIAKKGLKGKADDCSHRVKGEQYCASTSIFEEYRLSDHIDFQWLNIRESSDFQLTSTFSAFFLLDYNYLRKPQTVTQSATFFLYLLSSPMQLGAIEPNEYEHISNKPNEQQKIWWWKITLACSANTHNALNCGRSSTAVKSIAYI